MVLAGKFARDANRDVWVCYAFILLFKFGCIGLAAKGLIDLILSNLLYDSKPWPVRQA